jgi:hypothetical protein
VFVDKKICESKRSDKSHRFSSSSDSDEPKKDKIDTGLNPFLGNSMKSDLNQLSIEAFIPDCKETQMIP